MDPSDNPLVASRMARSHFKGKLRPTDAGACPMRPIAIFTTARSTDEARRIAAALVERRLAACVQITEIESFYRWKGAMQNEKEWRLLIKSTEAQYVAVEAAIRELHSYELPAIYAVAFEQAYAPYANWIRQESAGADVR